MRSTVVFDYKGKNYQLHFHQGELYDIENGTGRRLDMRGALAKKIQASYAESQWAKTFSLT